MDFGKGNLCAKCHQPRVLSVVDNKNVAVNLKTAADADSVYIKSSRFGPHHGPQSTLLAGKGYGAYEIGTISYSNGRHTDITNACITCHMAPSSSGKFIGGHSMKVIGEVEGNQTLNVNGCGATGCHAGKTASDMTTKINATQTRIQTLIDQAKALVIAKGWMYDVPSTDDNYELWKIPTTGSKAIKLNAKQAKACYNIKFIMEDRSQGIHNPDFAEALLKNSIETLQ